MLSFDPCFRMRKDFESRIISYGLGRELELVLEA